MLLIILLLKTGFSYGQIDSVIAGMPNKEYIQNRYDPETRTVNLSYNYSNKWGFDGDTKKDSLFFIGNGGAHTYFYPVVILSSDGLVRYFTSIQLDMPFFGTKETLAKYGKNPGVQVVIDDFTRDGIPGIYLNFDNPFGSIPAAWKSGNILTKYIVMSFPGGKLKVNDY